MMNYWMAFSDRSESLLGNDVRSPFLATKPISLQKAIAMSLLKSNSTANHRRCIRHEKQLPHLMRFQSPMSNYPLEDIYSSASTFPVNNLEFLVNSERNRKF